MEERWRGRELGKRPAAIFRMGKNSGSVSGLSPALSAASCQHRGDRDQWGPGGDLVLPLAGYPWQGSLRAMSPGTCSLGGAARTPPTARLASLLPVGRGSAFKLWGRGFSDPLATEAGQEQHWAMLVSLICVELRFGSAGDIPCALPQPPLHPSHPDTASAPSPSPVPSHRSRYLALESSSALLLPRRRAGLRLPLPTPRAAVSHVLLDTTRTGSDSAQEKCG